MNTTIYFVSKILGSVAVVAICIYLAVLIPTSMWLAFLLALIGLVAVHATRVRSPPRDYTKNPVTQTEIDLAKASEKSNMIQALINHLESTAHEYKDCDPCPVPDLLTKLGDSGTQCTKRISTAMIPKPNH